MTQRVLIVEDDTGCAEVLEMVLLGLPEIRVDTAADVAQARARLESECAYALVITDVNLPGEDGLSLIDSMRTMGCARVPVIVTTSSRDASVRERAEALGVAAFIEKPYSPARLRETVGNILHASS